MMSEKERVKVYENWNIYVWKWFSIIIIYHKLYGYMNT
jgi:hypothetical protein